MTNIYRMYEKYLINPNINGNNKCGLLLKLSQLIKDHELKYTTMSHPNAPDLRYLEFSIVTTKGSFGILITPKKIKISIIEKSNGNHHITKTELNEFIKMYDIPKLELEKLLYEYL